ncbi:MAG: type II toxin-antitoxin system Phd/YefM family antitoxin [Pseudonocardiaceae bacterium]
MVQIPVRVLNQDTASVMARVEGGETVEITRHGKVIGRIVPAAAAGELDDWVDAGRVTPATITGPIPMPRYQAPSGEDAADLLRQLRDEERW